MNELKEFLEKKAEEAETEFARREAIRGDWIGAVNRLLSRMYQWLKDNDPKNVLHIEWTEHRIRERVIGEYLVSGLRLSLPHSEVRIEPVARLSIGSYVGDSMGTSIQNGRVDMTNGDTRYLLYRKSNEPDEWVIVDDQNYRAKPLDQTSFEAAVLSLLR